MQPIGMPGKKLPRIARSRTANCASRSNWRCTAPTRADRPGARPDQGSLTHMCATRDHGWRRRPSALAARQARQGTIRLSAYHEGGHINICIADNGRGAQHVADQSQWRCRTVWSARPTSRRCGSAGSTSSIFAPGFSTAAAVTSVRPRRSAMDVVRPISIRSAAQSTSVGGREGSSVTIKIPRLLAIVSALIVEAGRSLCDPATGGRRTGAGPRQFRAPHRTDQGHCGIAVAQQAIPLMP